MLPFEELPKDYPYDLFRQQVELQPYPLVFVTVSGLHLLGLDSPGSKYEMRGVHVPTLRQLYGRDNPGESIESSYDHDGIQIDFITEDIKTFADQIMHNRCQALEDLFSPLVVHTTPDHDELKSIAKNCKSRRYAQSYLGLAEKQWVIFNKPESTKIEPLLHVYRMLLAGIHLMRTGEVEASLTSLNEAAKLPAVDDLVDLWLADPESCWLAAEDMDSHEREYKRLVAELESAAAESRLPEEPQDRKELDDFLIRLGCSRDET